LNPGALEKGEKVLISAMGPFFKIRENGEKMVVGNHLRYPQANFHENKE
jgi:hypothetical protein